MKKYMFLLIAVAAIFTTACKDDSGNGIAVPVTGVTIDQTDLLISPGVNKILRVAVVPDNATNKDVTWSSSDETVATIDPATGELAPLTVGSTVITVTTVDGGFSASRNVQVTNVPVTGVELPSEVTVAPGAKKTLIANVLSVAATNRAVTWSSDNESVAVIDPNTGELTAIDLGTANITVTTVENGFTASCKVYVVPGGAWEGFDITIQECVDDIVNNQQVPVPLDQVAPNQSLTNVAGYTLPDIIPLTLNGYAFKFASNFYRETTPYTSADNKTFEYCIQLKNNAPADSYVEFPELQNVGKVTVYGYCPNATNDLKLNLQVKGAGDNEWNNVESDPQGGLLNSLNNSNGLGKDQMLEFKYSSSTPVTLRLSRDPGTNYLGRIFRIVVEKY